VAEVRDVDVVYQGGVVALEKVSLTVREGDFLGVIGPNGAGKTTLLSVILGLTRPTRGSTQLFGGPVSPDGLRRVGYVPQKAISTDANFPATVYETVLLGRTMKASRFRRLGHGDLDRVEEAMSLLGIHDLKDRKIGQLSGGQFQRVILAKALAGDPDLLVLDEPTSGVDTPTRTEIYRIMEELNTDRGITLILSTHDIGVVKKLADRAVFLHGSVLFDGSTSELSGQVLSKMYDYPIEVVQDDRICDYPFPPVDHHEHS
jgi:zinc transport system ATP-binding protein